MAALAALATVSCHSDGGVLGEDERERSGPAVVRWVPSAISYEVGDVVIADLFIEEAQNVGTVAFHLLFDTDVLQFLPPAIEGPFMNEDGANTVFLAADQGGELVAAIARLTGAPGAHGTGLLATFEFKTIGPGSSGFQFVEPSVRDPMGQHLSSSFSVVQTRIVTPPSIPPRPAG